MDIYPRKCNDCGVTTTDYTRIYPVRCKQCEEIHMEDFEKANRVKREMGRQACAMESINDTR